MKKLYTSNKILFVLGSISGLVSLSYAITYYMPDYFGVEGWYSLLNNISISYIAAFIFYILQVYIPECKNRKRAQAILSPLFLDLIKFIEVTIACCRKYVSVNEDGSIVIDWWNKEQKILYFVPESDVSNGCNRQVAIKKTKEELREIAKIYKRKIEEIKERVDFKNCNQEIINTLSELEADDFFKSTIIVALMFEGTFIAFPDFYKSVDSFELLKDKFKKCCGIIIEKYNVRNADYEEIAICEAIFCQKALQAESIDELNETIYKENIRAQLRAQLSEEEVNKVIDVVIQATRGASLI